MSKDSRITLKEGEQSAGKGEAPNSENQKLNGQLKTNVPLTLADSHLDWGKWNTDPMTNISASPDYQTAFIGQGRQGSASGTEGWVKYLAGDGTYFTLYWDDPWSGDNSCTIGADGGSPGSYSYSVSYPHSGSDITANYTITHNAGLIPKSKDK